MGYINTWLKNGTRLTEKQHELFSVITILYDQQKTMYENRTHSIPDRIVSLAQHWIRPIVRGKAKAKTEFGAKLHISLVDGYARVERLSFDAYNESEDYFTVVERYRENYGRYPARILADKIYRSRTTLECCKQHGIQLTGPALGRPPKNADISKQAKRREYKDICDRNAVEGAFGTAKTAYGLARVAARHKDTSFCVIGLALLCMNLQKRLRSFLRRFFGAVFFEKYTVDFLGCSYRFMY